MTPLIIMLELLRGGGGGLAISEQKDSFKFTSKLFFFTEHYSAHSC